MISVNNRALYVSFRLKCFLLMEVWLNLLSLAHHKEKVCFFVMFLFVCLLLLFFKLCKKICANCEDTAGFSMGLCLFYFVFFISK